MKESRARNDHTTWCCAIPAAGVPPQWVNNRNIRRNLPAQYLEQTFQSVSLHAMSYRVNIIEHNSSESEEEIVPDDLQTFSDLENIEREDIGELMDITDKENIEADDGVDNNDMTDNATEKTELTNYEVNDFISVELKTAKGKAERYVAKITETMEDGSFMCSFLRSSQKIKTTYIFSIVPGTSVVLPNEITKPMEKPDVLRRGQLKFKTV
ncbi:hypothetical protein JTB14_020647 [Gonioctena quinquepunctata]|nr:hypothetical protein JTB14_020647 [Gonioctena quinquepunctata]